MADQPICKHCGDTGSVRVYGYEDYGVSYECEYCDHCDYGRSLTAADRAMYDRFVPDEVEQ